MRPADASRCPSCGVIYSGNQNTPKQNNGQSTPNVSDATATATPPRMKRCPACGNVVPADATACPSCGFVSTNQHNTPLTTGSPDTSEEDARPRRERIERGTGGGMELKCPKCGSTNIQVASSMASKGFGAGKGCLGILLFGPFGWLCGLCGMGKGKTKIIRVCMACGKHF